MVFDIHGSLSVLALVAGAFSLVPPPENVTVNCHNFQTTVYWNYSRPHLQTSFKLNISASDAGSVNVSVTDEHHLYDLTSFVWESEKRFSAFQSVTVSAAEGKHESKMVESTFTFNELKPAFKQCELDFPPVNLSMKGLDATVRFDNPHHYYETMKTMKLKQAYSAREFVFTVHLLNDGHQKIFTSEASDPIECPNKICTYSFNCPEMEKYCITLEGWMKGSNYEVPFKKTDPICATDKDTVQDTGIYTIIFAVVVPTVFVIGVCVVLLINVMAKTWKMIPSSLPKALKMPMDSSKYGNVMNIPYESVSTISFTEPDFNKSDCSLMVVTAEETDRSESQTYCSRSDPSSPKSIGSAYAEDRLSESSNQQKSKDTYVSELCSEEDSVETASVTLDPEEECSSGYDRPHRLAEVDVVDMGHGDVVKCYNRRC